MGSGEHRAAGFKLEIEAASAYDIVERSLLSASRLGSARHQLAAGGRTSAIVKNG
jgi:hypothetical protein